MLCILVKNNISYVLDFEQPFLYIFQPEWLTRESSQAIDIDFGLGFFSVDTYWENFWALAQSTAGGNTVNHIRNKQTNKHTERILGNFKKRKLIINGISSIA